MLKNNLKIAWRNLAKNKGTAITNLLGLSIGIAACLIIALYIRHEISYDNDVPNQENLYRLYGVYNIDGQVRKGAHFSANTSSTIENDFEEVTLSARLMDNPLFYGAGSNEIRIEGVTRQHHEDGFTYADQSFLDLFSIPMIYGDRNSALSQPKSIVISEKIAQKYFNGENPVGRTIYLNGQDSVPFSIGGVMRDFPSNSHLDYDFLLTLTDVEFGAGEQTRWLQSNYFCYLEIAPGTNISSLKERITDDIIKNYMKPALQDAGAVLAETIEDQAYLDLQSIRDIHLYSSDIFDSKVRGDIKYIWLFGIIAFFILFIAVINFVNLSTAQSANRAKEVGLRKVLGSSKGYLINQFLTESIVLTLMAFAAAFILVQLTIPYFNRLSGSVLVVPYDSVYFAISFLGTAILIGLVAGIYPSFYLSAFNPVKVLKGKLRLGSKSGGLRSTLVVVQFTISAILIASTIVIHKQMNFILNKEVGFDKEQVIQIHGTNMLGSQVETFKNELIQLPSVANASISDYLPIEGTKRNGNSFWNEGRAKIDERVPGQAWVIDENYLNTLNIELIAGRNFNKDRATDNQSVIINEKMAQRLNLDDPIGKKITRGGDQLYEIIGVVKDFHFQSFRQQVEPLCLFAGISPSIISIKVNPGNMAALLDNLEKKWLEFNPDLDFRYEFMDQSFAAMYQNVSRIRSIFTSFAVLAIFIACLGLFALAAFIVEQRSKEMSIRKVLGATTEDIFQTLTRNFAVLVFISLLLAIPVSLYLTKRWLQDFAYRIDITWEVFLIAAGLVLFIAIITVSFHTLRSSLTSPSIHLRNE